MRFRLMGAAGAPLSLGFTTDFTNNWMLSGYTPAQRERANLEWSSGYATVDVQWAGAAAAIDPSVALDCDLQSTIRLPTHDGPNHAEAVRISGHNCIVSAEGTPYAGIEAQTWGLGYVWSRPQRQSEASLSVIDPVWTHALEFQDPGRKALTGCGSRRRSESRAIVSDWH